MGPIIALLVTVLVVYFILKKVKAQAVLIAAGMILMATAIFLGIPLLDAKQSTGFVWFDIFKYIENVLSSRTAGLGLLIMSVAGFSKYMDHVGASKVLVKLFIKPLGYLKSPYLVLALSYLIGQILNIFVPSASGLGLLLMVTIYPIIVGLGVSPLAATAVIGTTACLDLGPGSGNAVLASRNAGMDVALYFTEYQIPLGLLVMATIAVLHYFVQKYYDKKAGHVAKPLSTEELTAKDENDAPMYYALLPVIPVVLILVFSKLLIADIKMTVVSAMLISMTVVMILEVIRHREVKKSFASIQVFFDGMGKQFATVITLIVAGEVFANGLVVTGGINALIEGAQGAGLGSTGMIIVMTLIISGTAIIMGSGNAPFFAFAALVPTLAGSMDINPVLMLLPMQFAAGIARSVSPITAAIVSVAGVSNQNTVEVVKRTAIPMVGALIMTLVGTFIINGV